MTMSDSLRDILLVSSEPGFEAKFEELRRTMLAAARLAGYDSQENLAVTTILREVAEQGDAAVARYTAKFDGVTLSPQEFCVTPEAMKEAHGHLDARLLDSLRKAIHNVREYQQKIFIGNQQQFSQGTGIRYTPIRRVGVCVPGAAAPLPSTVIMTVVPAQVAGVKEIAVVSPPRYRAGGPNRGRDSQSAIRNPQSAIGTIHPVILGVCHELKVEEVYRLGGVQAVGALAHGTQTIAKVDKIVGPGNKWVQAAKKNVQANPAWVAADMLSQAEHGTDSSAIVLTDSQSLAAAILEQLQDQLKALPRAAEASQSLSRFSRIIVVKDMGKAIDLANEFACEHLEVQCGADSRRIAEGITNAGAVFIGPHTPVAVGDYWAGPSHTLPTGARAKFSSALTCNDFVKSISLIEYSAEQLAAAADDIVRLAEVEGLDAHARSVQIRRQ
jgi:histidinol dehydrogenase